MFCSVLVLLGIHGQFPGRPFDGLHQDIQILTEID